MERAVGGAFLRLVLGDITRVPADAIVNAANSGLLGGGGVDGAIHASGGPAILEECRRIRSERGPCPPGAAVLTGAGLLPAKWVIHAVGPVWRGGGDGEPELLASAYRAVLALCKEMGCRSAALPSLSTGAYGYPPGLAAPVALRTTRDFLLTPSSLREVTFVLQPSGVLAAYEKALAELV